MIIKITNKCQMGCSHCSENSTMNGEHMSMETFAQVLEFIKKTRPLVVLISGGEPTLHPNFKEITKSIYKIVGKKCTIITSNGLWYWENEQVNHAKIKEYLSMGVAFQITNDNRYYPKYVPHINHPLFFYENHIMSLSSVGRAKMNGMENINTNAPKCFNYISICKMNSNNFIDGMRVFESNMKFCSPSVNINGEVSPGEFGFCKSIGTVWDNEDTLYKNLCSFKCNECGMVDKLSPVHRSILELKKEV